MDTHTPPDTVQELTKHRAALKDAQAASFNLDAFALGTPMETPAFVGRGVTFAAPEQTPAAASAQDRVRDILLYSDPPVSYLALIVGTIVLGVGHYLLSGVHNTSLLTACSYLLLCNMAWNFLRGLVSKDWHQAAQWQGSAFARSLADRAVAAVDGLAWAHDKLLATDNPTTMLRVAVTLWMLAMLGRWFSVWTLATLGFAATFSLPAAYMKHQQALVGTSSSLGSALKSRWDGLLSRKQKLLVLSIALLVVLVNSSWSTVLSAVLVGALAVRCQLKPAEVQRIIELAEPYTQTVRKQTRRVSVAATDFAFRSLGGKSHAR